MKTIIVYPQGQEEAFIQEAKNKGFEQCLFISNKPKDQAILLVTKKDLQKQQKQKTLLITSSDQSVFEHLRPTFVMGLEAINHHDKTHQRLSGFNQVMAQLAHKNKIILLYDINTLQDPILFGRVQQNIKLCNKFKVTVALTKFVKDPLQLPSPEDLKSYAKLLGINTSTIY